MLVLFLDVDGVLNCVSSCAELDQEFLLRLKHIIDATGAKIVLSSTWRLYPSHKRLLSSKLELLNLSIFGSTIELLNCKRCFEIQEWLDRHLDVEQFAILDDDPDACVVGHFFHTSWQSGLTAEITQAVIDFFGAKNHD